MWAHGSIRPSLPQIEQTLLPTEQPTLVSFFIPASISSISAAFFSLRGIYARAQSFVYFSPAEVTLLSSVSTRQENILAV